MTNLVTWAEDSPDENDDVSQGALRIREVKSAVRERMNRDHVMGGTSHTSPTADPPGGAPDADSGYHRRITLLEADATSDQSATVLARVQALNAGLGRKASEVWLQSITRTAGTEQYILYRGSNEDKKEVITDIQEQTLTNKTLTSSAINTPVVIGGTVNNTVIGGVTPAAATITDLTTTGNTVVGNAVTDTVTLNATVQGNSGTGAGAMYAGISGEIKMYAGVAAPTGWLFCHGQSLVIANYLTLHAAIGTTYGSTPLHFNVPDFRGRSPLGVNKDGVGEDKTDAYTERDRGISGGTEEVKLTGAQSGTAAHSHTITDPGHTHTYRKGTKSDRSEGGTHSLTNDVEAQTTGGGTTGITINDSTGEEADDAHTNESPFLTVNFIIKT